MWDLSRQARDQGAQASGDGRWCGGPTRRGARVAANAGAAASGAIAWIEENRAGGTADQAADKLWLLASFDAFDRLYTGRSRTAEEVSRILVSTAERSLCR